MLDAPILGLTLGYLLVSQTLRLVPRSHSAKTDLQILNDPHHLRRRLNPPFTLMVELASLVRSLVTVIEILCCLHQLHLVLGVSIMRELTSELARAFHAGASAISLHILSEIASTPAAEHGRLWRVIMAAEIPRNQSVIRGRHLGIMGYVIVV